MKDYVDRETHKTDFKYLRDRLDELENRFKLRLSDGGGTIDIARVIVDIMDYLDLKYRKQDKFILIKSKNKQKK